MTVNSFSITPLAALSGELTLESLALQNERFRGSGGVSEENRALGFSPAFYDMETGVVHPSCFANGLSAPMHVLDGLPEDLVVARLESGRVTAVKPGVVAGFVRHGHFFTREQAARATAQMRDRDHMLSNPQDHDRLLDIWERFVLEQEYSRDQIRPVVEDSWRRCQEVGVDPELNLAPLMADREALEYARYRKSELRNAALPVLKRAGELLFEAESLVLLADTDGMVLDVAGDRRTRNTACNINLVEGGLWGESAAGTNAIGTALAANEPVQLYGAEHFCTGIKPFTCSADVIRDPHDGRVLGVVDLSGKRHSYQRHALDFAMTAARLIEANLVANYFHCREDVIEGTRSQFLRWQGDGLLAFDRRGRLVKANALAHRAMKNLGEDMVLSPQTRIPALDLDAAEASPSQPRWLTQPRRHPILRGGRTVGTLVVLPCHH